MTVYSYIQPMDRGFAPNPYHGIMTLATCKGKIRNKAEVGDVVMGFTGKNYSPTPKLIYLMIITGKIPFWEYMEDSQYVSKDPQGWRHTGDRIYRRQGADITMLLSWHTYQDGRPYTIEMQQDLRGKFVLLSSKFWYFGSSAPELPPLLTNKYFRRTRATNVIRQESGIDIINYLTSIYNTPTNVSIYGSPYDLPPTQPKESE